MNTYQIGAGGYYSSGTAVVVASTPEQGAKMVNEASRALATDKNNLDYDLTYYAANAVLLPVTGHMAGVLVLREYGLPHLPSKGSGISVTF